MFYHYIHGRDSVRIILAVICHEDVVPQWKGQLWSTLFDVLIHMIHFMDENHKHLELAMIDALTLSLSYCYSRLQVIKVSPLVRSYLICGAYVNGTLFVNHTLKMP